MPDFIPRPDTAALTWMEHLIAGVKSDPAGFGIDPENLERATAAVTSFKASHAEALLAQTHAHGAVTKKNNDRNSAEQETRNLVRDIRSKRGLSTEAKVTLGLKVGVRKHDSKRPRPPANLVAYKKPGAVWLNWEANGNRPGTMYLIEAQFAPDAAWQLISAESSTRFLDRRRLAAEHVYYRVIAKRAGEVSDISNVAKIDKEDLPMAA